MAIASKKAKALRVDARRDALRALVAWDGGSGNLDELSLGFLRHLPKIHRAHYTELTKGTVRNLRMLDFKLKQILDRPLLSLTPWIRNILRLGAYQLEFMRTPPPLAVNAMVELAKSYGHSGTAKLVNGVLRKWQKGAPASEALGILYSHPDWLVERWVGQFGESDTIKLLEWNNTLPTLEIAANTLRTTPEMLKKLFRCHGVSAEKGDVTGSLLVEHSGPVDLLPGFQEGLFWVQNFSAQLPAYVLAPKSGEIILDLCAAPGGKTCQLASMTEDRAAIIAVDMSAKRLTLVDQNRRRMGMRSIELLTADGTHLEHGLVDAVLLDAPCSATGVFRREVDARWNKTPEDIPRFASRQLELLKNAVRLLKAGGRLVYSTCSLEKEENEEVVNAFLALERNCVLEDPLPYLPEQFQKMLASPEKLIHILPQKHQMDGFFIARIKRK